MKRTSKLACWTVLLAMAAAPAWAGDQVEPDKNGVILKKLDDLQKSVDKLQNEATMGNLKAQQALDDIAKLKETVGQLRKDVDALKTPGTTRVAMSPSTTSGRIQLVNVWPEQMTVIVNQMAYRLAPGEVRILEAQPAGSFVYEVPGARTGPQPRLLAANQTFTITVYPR